MLVQRVVSSAFRTLSPLVVAWLLNVFDVCQEGHTHQDDIVISLLRVRRLLESSRSNGGSYDRAVVDYSSTGKFKVSPRGNVPVFIDDVQGNLLLRISKLLVNPS